MLSKVSVIIPCYNGAAVVDQSIESVYIQDYPNIELIVVDDGSTDNSREKILAWESCFAQKGFVLKYVYQENRGPGGAIDTGLKHITGKYLTLLDADDYYLPHSIARKAEFLDAYPDFVGVRSNGWQLRGNEKKLFVTSEKEKLQTNYFHGLLCEGFTNWAGSYMVRSDSLFEFYPDRNIYPSRFGQNMQILLPVAYKRKFGFVDEPLMVYVLHENSHSQAASPEEQWEKDDRNFYGYFDIYRHMIDTIVQDETEHKMYRNRINSWFHRHECDRAVRAKDRKALHNHFKALCATGYVTLKDKIDYYAVLNPAKAIVYKMVRRLKARNGI